MDIEKLKAHLNSEEGKREAREWFSKEAKLDDMVDSQVERAHIKLKSEDKFTTFLEKVIAKYNTKEYSRRWYCRGIEPEESLLWFLNKYAGKYGRECDEHEWEIYGNMFTTELYFIHGYYFNTMQGQGCAINIHKFNPDGNNYNI